MCATAWMGGRWRFCVESGWQHTSREQNCRVTWGTVRMILKTSADSTHQQESASFEVCPGGHKTLFYDGERWARFKTRYLSETQKGAKKGHKSRLVLLVRDPGSNDKSTVFWGLRNANFAMCEFMSACCSLDGDSHVVAILHARMRKTKLITKSLDTWISPNYLETKTTYEKVTQSQLIMAIDFDFGWLNTDSVLKRAAVVRKWQNHFR